MSIISAAKAKSRISRDSSPLIVFLGKGSIIEEICLENDVLDVLVGEDRPNRDKIWQTRQSIREVLVKLSPIMTDEDVVIPRS